MDTLETIFTRHSIRTYKPDPIPADHLKQILEAARQAPSASNRQPWHFVVVADEEQKQRLAHLCGQQMWMAGAAYIVVAVGLPTVSAKWYRVDVAIALQTLVLAAHSLGYGTCWIGDYRPAEIKELLHLPAEMEVVACTPLGVPGVTPVPRPRKEWDQVFSADTYGQRVDI
jgi:nitroreductase